MACAGFPLELSSAGREFSDFSLEDDVIFHKIDYSLTIMPDLIRHPGAEDQ